MSKFLVKLKNGSVFITANIYKISSGGVLSFVNVIGNNDVHVPQELSVEDTIRKIRTITYPSDIPICSFALNEWITVQEELNKL